MCRILLKTKVTLSLPPTNQKHGINNNHRLIVISIDGFRWDYLNRNITPNLNKIHSGVNSCRASYLSPQFPSKTFPNHFTLATGLYPESHGIISNEMIDPKSKRKKFSYATDSVYDAQWITGEPIWVTAIKHNLKAACCLWPGCVVPIQGILPNPIISPVQDNPDLTMAYLSEVDTASHKFGVDSTETLQAIKDVDRAIGQFMENMTKSGLIDTTNLIILSDHGMTNVKHTIDITKYIDMSKVFMSGSPTPILSLYPLPHVDGPSDSLYTGLTVDEIYNALHGKHPNLQIYRKEDVPKHYHFSLHSNTAISPIVGIADLGYSIFTGTVLPVEKGTHGYDPSYPDMKGILIASGPNIKSQSKPFDCENTDLFNVYTTLLNIPSNSPHLPKTNSTTYLKDLILQK
ncbi:type I phosphodiesterase/nucleotide pyrophosphatase family protein [Cavenderia fasciculata]|uniref:Type I phosphodiesterase/nucleotide pyrophosphatase family protein n=1 Tax=Cavenderia fasciculata TaxID=261658 RepID=F4PXT0_CACFS|nr:type I phosphodiesterase/nucleotide pyrophosphatase family protein [Cavenderia fasciculata]EGG19590.1 type I phosphodiesterase/nucleotide pyrophosphatase family protein [Cavenderia fasciculata]|eukprot:XP_004357884.1 type I phosphodiesterase/nucleotide pyrophosphatase family protein [Cavenderia fasciculata]